jgi:hypothetical protein
MQEMNRLETVCFKSKGSMFESASFHAVSTDLRSNFPSNFPRNFNMPSLGADVPPFDEFPKPFTVE